LLPFAFDFLVCELAGVIRQPEAAGSALRAPRGEVSHWRARHLRETMSARTSQANPIKNTMKNSVPSVVRAMLRARERGTRFIGL
jgi:hypothetical protein